MLFLLIVKKSQNKDRKSYICRPKATLVHTGRDLKDYYYKTKTTYFGDKYCNIINFNYIYQIIQLWNILEKFVVEESCRQKIRFLCFTSF